jgi:hypothetical protein
MKSRPLLLILIVTVLLISSCIKEKYDMNRLDKNNRLSPTWAISAVKGDVSLLDMLKPTDTVVYDQDKLMILVFKKDTVVTLTMDDFSAKGPLDEMTATIEPGTFDLGIDKVLQHISGDFLISSPTLKFNYLNSFSAPLEISLAVTGERKNESVDLGTTPFRLTGPDTPGQVVSATYIIDKTNSSLPELISLPPEMIYYSGLATLNPPEKKGEIAAKDLGINQLEGSFELDVPMELRMSNLQFADTTDNFLKNDNDNNDAVKPENFELLRIDINADNGFPLGVTLSMSLYDSQSNTILKTVNATDLLKPAPVDGNGKATGITGTTTQIEFTQEFFSSIDKADRIIFIFSVNTTDGGTKDVKIYSDYRIDFNASLVVKPGIELN